MTGLPYESAKTTGTVAVAKWGRVTLLSPRASPHGYAWRDTMAHELTHLARHPAPHLATATVPVSWPTRRKARHRGEGQQIAHDDARGARPHDPEVTFSVAARTPARPTRWREGGMKRRSLLVLVVDADARPLFAVSHDLHRAFRPAGGKRHLAAAQPRGRPFAVSRQRRRTSGIHRRDRLVGAPQGRQLHELTPGPPTDQATPLHGDRRPPV